MKTSLSALALLTGTVAAGPLEQRNAVCTSVVFISPTFEPGPTHTVYTTTTKATETVDCGQCHAVVPSYLPLGVDPLALMNATITASAPTTVTSYVCSIPTPRPVPILAEQRSPKDDYYQAPYPKIYTVQPPGVQTPDCTVTRQVDPVVPDSTSTVYTEEPTTTTKEVECGGCAMVWSTGVLNFFAPVKNTATVTEGVSTKLDLACATPA